MLLFGDALAAASLLAHAQWWAVCMSPYPSTRKLSSQAADDMCGPTLRTMIMKGHLRHLPPPDCGHRPRSVQQQPKGGGAGRLPDHP